MSVKLVWSVLARDDLLNIYALIGLEQPAAAERYFERMEAKIELLRTQPRIGMRRPDIRESARVLVEYPYLILYAIEPDTDEGPVECVEIVRIVDGRRELSHLFLS
jgi:toxin ParE1/3/4